MARTLSCLAVVCSTLSPRPVLAQSESPEAIEGLRHEIAELKRDYEARIGALEKRLAELEAARPAAKAGPEDVLERLKAAAREAAGGAQAAAPAPAAAAEPSGGRGRNLNRLNPELSFTANLLGVASDSGREEFVNQEVEVDLQSALDPFSKSRVTLSVGQEGELDVEEAYVTYASLPGGLTLTGGKFRQAFGVLNRQHLHALPQIDYPLVLSKFFDAEGLDQTGLSFDWLLPRPWASANEITFQVTDGEAEAFGGQSFKKLVALAHVKNYWDLSSAAYFEWGLSGAAGETADGGASRVWGTDLTYHWQPPLMAKRREVTFRTEVLHSQRDDPFGIERKAWGGYSYLEGMLRQNLYLGVRYDFVEDPLDPARHTWSVIPYLTWWQSEFVRLRAQLERLEEDPGGDTENRFVFQISWAAGPHKHETY